MQSTDTAQMLHDDLSAVLPDNFVLRDETDEDFDFIVGLYAETRQEELAPVPWTDEAKQQFLRWQCGLQRDHYRKHYTNGRFWILERSGEGAVGRLYIQAGSVEIRIMDIALLPELRNRGLGSRMLQVILAAATQQGIEVSLHVEPDNPAQRLYQRLGFKLAEERGAHHFLVWQAGREL